MSKVLKTIGKIVTIAALAAGALATGGLLLAGAPLFTAIGTGFGAVIGGLGISATTLLAGGALITAIGAATAGAPRLEETGANQRGQPYVDAGSVGAYVFGETAAPLALVFEENYGANKEFVANVMAHAWHKIDSYQTLHVDAELVSFSGNAATGSFAGILTWLRNVGAGASQAALSLPGTSWPATAKGYGVAHSSLIWNFKNQSKLSGGVPTNIVVKIRGALLYDPRLDTTAGGSGSQRYADPATWAYNDGNAALVALRYIIGERAADGRLIWGVGEAQTDVDMASFIAAANVADEVRDSVARYNLAGFFPTSNDHESFFRQWEANTGGKITRVGGRRYIWLPHNDLVPLATITDDDVLAGAVVTLRAATPIESLVNTGRGRYVSAADLFQGAIYPDVIEATAVAEDGAPRVLDLDFSWVQVRSQAERTARQAVRRSRFGRVWSLAVGWEGILYPVFSILALSLKETDGVATLARVIDKTMSASGVCILTMQEENAAIYDDTIPLGSAVVNNSVVNRVSRFGTLTPRYSDNTAIDDLRPADQGATRGSAGIGPPGIRIGEGATTIRLEANKTGGGTDNDGEIGVKKGFWRLPDGSTRTISSNLTLQTPFEGAATPIDGIFYVVWGVALPSVRFSAIGDQFGTASGMFAATYNRLTDEWRAWGNNNQSAAFAPLATDIIFAIGLKTAADVGIALLIPQVASIEGFSSPGSLDAAVVKSQSFGGTDRRVPLGAAKDAWRDGAAVTFTTPWPAPPLIGFDDGGVHYDPALGAVRQERVNSALNVSTSGFTASLRLKAVGASVPQSDGPGSDVGGVPSWQITKSVSGEDSNDTYLFSVTVNASDITLPDGGKEFGQVVVGFYTRTVVGGLWTHRGSTIYKRTIGTKVQSVSVDGLGSGAAFGVHLESNSNGTINSFNSVTYDTGAAGGDVSAALSTEAPVKAFVIGDSEAV